MENNQEQSLKIKYFYETFLPVLIENAPKFGWPADLKKEDFEPKELDGISNMTYRVKCLAQGDHPTILAKRFGEGVLKKLIDRKVDNKVSTSFGDLGIGPKVLWCDDEQRIEEFIQAETFTLEDMNDQTKRRRLAYYVQKMHRVAPEGLNTDPMFTRCLDDTFPLIKLFHESFDQKKEQGLFSEEEIKKIEYIKKLVSDSELEWIKENHPNSKNVLSHNDFLNGNILKLDGNKIKLIDFEYATYNPRALDLANFLTETLFDYDVKEHPFFKYNWDQREEPEQFKDIVIYYLLFSSFEEDCGVDRAYELVGDLEAAQQQLLENFGGDQAKVDAELDLLMGEMWICTLLSQFLWALWGVIMCKDPNIDFYYIDFGYVRAIDYYRIKEKYFTNDQTA